jgi:hypothetical protein
MFGENLPKSAAVFRSKLTQIEMELRRRYRAASPWAGERLGPRDRGEIAALIPSIAMAPYRRL